MGNDLFIAFFLSVFYVSVIVGVISLAIHFQELGEGDYRAPTDQRPTKDSDSHFPIKNSLENRRYTNNENCKTNDSAKRPKSSYERSIVVLTSVIAAVTAFYAGAAALQLLANRLTSIRELRAYINPVAIELRCPSCGIQNYRLPPPVPGPVRDVLIITYENGGKTPAYSATGHSNWETESLGHMLPQDFHFPDLNTMNRGQLKVVESRDTTNPDRTGIFSSPIDVPTVMEARSGKVSLYFYGHLDYRDIFNEWRTTPYCYLYGYVDSKDFFIPCPYFSGRDPT